MSKRYIHWCLSHSPNPYLARNPDMCPDWESYRQAFGSRAHTQSTDPQQPGRSRFFSKHINFGGGENLSSNYCFFFQSFGVRIWYTSNISSSSEKLLFNMQFSRYPNSVLRCANIIIPLSSQQRHPYAGPIHPQSEQEEVAGVVWEFHGIWTSCISTRFL